MKNLLKVVWICDINSKDIAAFLPREIKEKEKAAPFDKLFRDIFEEHSESLELHLVTDYESLSENLCFVKNGITYHLIATKQLFKKYKYEFNALTKSIFIRRKYNKVINQISPDLVCIFGTEIIRSHVFFDIKYPVLVIIQGFIHHYKRHPEYSALNFINRFIMNHYMNRELKILKKAKYIGGIRTKAMEEVIDGINPKVKKYKFWYPISIPNIQKVYDKKCDADIAFIARVNPQKGIEDLIIALGLLCSENYNYSLKVIGNISSPDYKLKLLKMCEDRHVAITIKGFLPDDEMLNEFATSKLYVIPTYFDIMPGTLIHSMFIGTPAIAYATDGIPELNEEEESVFLVGRGDINGLKNAIKTMMANEELRRGYAERAQRVIRRKIDNDKIYDEMMAAFKDIISNKG